MTLSERVESGINDRTTESLIYFCGSDIKSLTSPKIETQISSSIQRIRNIEINELQYSMKYLAILLETLTYGKLLTAQDYLLITHAITSGILKILNERVEHSETVTEEKQSLEIKELQRKLDNSTSTSEETKRMAR